MADSHQNSYKPLDSGTQLHQGKYRIISVLGHGGFGVAYLAEHIALRKQVAIKEFFPKTFCNRDENSTSINIGTSANCNLVERFKAKFIKEARTIASLSHPGIVKILDVFEENNTAYYVMDYIVGESLSDLQKNYEGKIPLEKAIGWIKQVGNALTYIHSHHLNHLDVKPANIMIDRNGEAILIDFGQSKQYDDGGKETSTTPIGISHGYAPPEQYRNGGVSNFSPQADIYALGATLYKLITGVTPPDAMTLIDESLTFPTDTPPHICEAITRAMSINKKDRSASVNEFLNQLKSNDNNEATDSTEYTVIDVERTPNTTTTRPKSAKDKIILVVILMAILISTLLVIYPFISRHQGADEQSTIQSAELYEVWGTHDRSEYVNGLRVHAKLKTSEPGQRVAIVAKFYESDGVTPLLDSHGNDVTYGRNTYFYNGEADDFTIFIPYSDLGNPDEIYYKVMIKDGDKILDESNLITFHPIYPSAEKTGL